MGVVARSSRKQRTCEELPRHLQDHQRHEPEQAASHERGGSLPIDGRKGAERVRVGVPSGGGGGVGLLRGRHADLWQVSQLHQCADRRHCWLAGAMAGETLAIFWPLDWSAPSPPSNALSSIVVPPEVIEVLCRRIDWLRALIARAHDDAASTRSSSLVAHLAARSRARRDQQQDRVARRRAYTRKTC